MIAFSLPLSEWLLSFSIILLTIFWLSTGDFRKLISGSGKGKYVFVFLMLYGIYLLWMLKTEDLFAGFTELKLKLPLLVLPLVIGFSYSIRRGDILFILSSFIAGTVASTSAGFIMNAGEVFSGIADTRELSPFISHIRLSIMTVFAIFSSISIWLNEKFKRWRLLYLFAGIWLIIFLSLIFSFSGIILFLVALVFSALYFIKRNRPWKYIYIVALFIVSILLTGILVHEVGYFYKVGSAYPLPYDSLTLNGNPYWHDTLRADVENGNRVWVYLCEDELRKEWNNRSQILYDSLDRKGQHLKYTLIRYMTSVGLRKDSAGLVSLTAADINRIENGTTNKKFSEWNPWRKKIYETVWQIDYYIKGGNPSGHSLTQRLEFIKTGLNLWKRYSVAGTGTGDLRKEFYEQYRIDGRILAPRYRLLSHNQFITFLATFGIVGFVIILFSIIYPFFATSAFRRYLPSLFMLIILLSMMWEDTLETHTGISFFVYFYSVFVFGYEEKKRETKGPELYY